MEKDINNYQNNHETQCADGDMNTHYLYSMLLLCTALMGLVEWVL